MCFSEIMVCLSLSFSVLCGGYHAAATCMDLGCDVTSVDDSCNALERLEVVEGERVLVEATCSFTCSAPGSPGGVSTEPMGEHNVDRVEILREGCDWPELLHFVVVPDICPGRAVVTPETQLPAGKYIVRAGGRTNLEITITSKESEEVDSAADTACPTQYEYNEWSLAELRKKEQQRKERLYRLEQERLARRQREIEEAKRTCTGFWSEYQKACVPRKPKTPPMRALKGRA